MSTNPDQAAKSNSSRQHSEETSSPLLALRTSLAAERDLAVAAIARAIRAAESSNHLDPDIMQALGQALNNRLLLAPGDRSGRARSSPPPPGGEY